MHYSIWCMLKSYLDVVLKVFLSNPFQIFGLFLPLMLYDGGCLNFFLLVDRFLSNSTYLSMGQRYTIICGTLGLVVINGIFPCY
jgi:hypothetical protein